MDDGRSSTAAAGMVGRDRDWALDAIACLQHGMGGLLEIAAL
jgi:hypothetical protein